MHSQKLHICINVYIDVHVLAAPPHCSQISVFSTPGPMGYESELSST